ncbi:neuropeptide FF receptor 2-like [Branchiostoma lanceolatum]|uniref:neuropeptide FF receptor 2-like n=1 Tax=Branchiostoma lanceolatum TaxID=7740 RepID=UPI003451E909
MANDTISVYEGLDFFNDSTNGTQTDMLLAKYKHGAVVSGLIILAYALVFLLCVVGNVVVCAVVIKTPRLRTVTNYFILNLAVSDLLVAIFCMPFTLVEHILNDYQFGDVMCRVNPTIQGISVAASVYTMTAIAYDRYKAIVFPTEPRMSLSKMKIALAGIWIGAVAVMVPQVFVLQVETFISPRKTMSVNVCMETWPDIVYKKTYTFMLFSLVYVGPLAVISFFYCRIMYKLSMTPSSAVDDPQRGSQFAVTKKRMRVLKMLITVVVLFALFWLPLYTCWMLGDFARLSQKQLSVIHQYVYPIAHWLGYSNSCANPIVYGFFNTNIRNNLDSMSIKRRFETAKLQLPKRNGQRPANHGNGRECVEMQPLGKADRK